MIVTDPKCVPKIYSQSSKQQQHMSPKVCKITEVHSTVCTVKQQGEGVNVSEKMKTQTKKFDSGMNSHSKERRRKIASVFTV